MDTQKALIELTNRFSARNYLPLPVVLNRGEGVWVWDTDNKKYLDCLSAYSALNQGHRHPKIIHALHKQADLLTLTSGAFYNDQMGLFLEKLCKLSQMELALPMNTGVEAVETAIKAIRMWGYLVKGIPDNQAEIIVCADNFHGRTISAISMSSEPSYRNNFGPFTPGFKIVEYDSSAAVENAINENTAAILIEPIQGEAGIKIPGAGYLSGIQAICKQHNLLLALDEIQTGLGRTGKLFCYQHESGVKPDILIVGKALSGGVYPISAVLSSREVLGLFNPGQHGSTFAGNPLAAAVGSAALDVIVEENLAERSKESGRYLLERLNRELRCKQLVEIRGKGLIIGIELKIPAGAYCERLMHEGILCKETHDNILRIAPPLIIEGQELDFVVDKIAKILSDHEKKPVKTRQLDHQHEVIAAEPAD